MPTNFQSAPVAHLDELHEATALYTVSAIVNRLLDRLDWPISSGKLLDPDCFYWKHSKRLDVSNASYLLRIWITFTCEDIQGAKPIDLQTQSPVAALVVVPIIAREGIHPARKDLLLSGLLVLRFRGDHQWPLLSATPTNT
jgi:hypothetical protein